MTLNTTAFLFALTLAFNVSAQTVDTTKAVEDLPNLVKVNENLLRGGRPTAAGMKKLKALGVTTILNIENSEEHIEADRKFAAANGLRFISVPFATFKKPTDEKVDYVLKIMRDRSMGRVYLHCKHGRDRTGMIMGLYRVEADGWHPKTAYQEMKDRGFRTILWELKDYYKDRTNY